MAVSRLGVVMRPQPPTTTQRLTAAVKQREERRQRVRAEQAAILSLNSTIATLMDELVAERSLAKR